MTITRVPVTFFNSDTGEILGEAYMDEDNPFELYDSDRDYIDGTFDGSLFYIDLSGEPTPVSRKQFAEEITVSTNTVTGVPVGTQAFCYNTMQVVDDGVITLEVDVMEVVTIKLLHPHYFPMQLEVSCVPV